MKQNCNNCRHFAETVDHPDPASRGQCVRYPIPEKPISRFYWCGEWKKRLAWQSSNSGEAK